MAQPERSDGTSPAPVSGRNLMLAVGSAVLFATLFLISAFINAWALLSFVAVVVVIAVLEVDAALRTTDVRPPTVVVLLTGVPMLAASYVYGADGQLTALAIMVTGIVLWVLVDRRDPTPIRSAGAALLIGVWVPFMASFLALLLQRPNGAWFIIITVGLTAASDIAAYAVGSRFGRRKLAPAVSPGKTWEGATGGMAGAMLVAGIVAPLLVEQLSVGRAVALGALVAVVAVVGDLAESAVKRSLGVKDLGRLLPGHGGMMDRVDAMLFTLPVAHLVLLAGRL
ncbi:MAG: phosphatidate cytidylyltransferase [Actinobacteria bacterium]|nr:phosphatidate cytidylyltransferase [Actinomycetota bacterium]